MGNDHLSNNSGSDSRSCIKFPFHHALNQVDFSTNLLDEMIVTKVILRPTKKPRIIGPHKSISKNNSNKKKSRLENKKFRSVGKPLYGVYVDPSIDNDNIPQQRLLYTNKDKKNYQLMDTGVSIVGIQTATLLVTHWISYGHPTRNKRAGYLFEFHLSITLAVIWISRTVAGPKIWMSSKNLWEFFLILYWLP